MKFKFGRKVKNCKENIEVQGILYVTKLTEIQIWEN